MTQKLHQLLMNVAHNVKIGLIYIMIYCVKYAQVVLEIHYNMHDVIKSCRRSQQYSLIRSINQNIIKYVRCCCVTACNKNEYEYTHIKTSIGSNTGT